MSESNALFLLFVSKSPVDDTIGESSTTGALDASFMIVLVVEWIACLALFWLMMP